MNASSQTRTLQKRRRAAGYDKQFARLGKEDGTLRDLESNAYWARPISNSGTLGAATTFKRLPGAHFRARAGLLVELRYSQGRELMIAGEADDGLNDGGADTFLGNLGDPAARGLIKQEEMADLFCRKAPGQQWTAQVLPGATLIGTTWVEVPTTPKLEIDLSGDVPSAGNHCYVAVFLLDDGTLTSTTSTPQANDGSAPLDSTDVQECITAMGAGNWLALRAFVFDGDQDDFSDSRDLAKDMRSPFEQSGATSGGGGGSIGDVIIIEEQQSQGTDGGTFTSGAWRTRALNTEVNDSGGLASVSSSQVTVAAGTYDVEAEAIALFCNLHQIRLYDITNSAVLKVGIVAYANAANLGASLSTLAKRITLAGTTVLELQHQCQTTAATNGFGAAGNFTTEVYARLKLLRIA